jgi:hypothetical protein
VNAGLYLRVEVARDLRPQPGEQLVVRRDLVGRGGGPPWAGESSPRPQTGGVGVGGFSSCVNTDPEVRRLPGEGFGELPQSEEGGAGVGEEVSLGQGGETRQQGVVARRESKVQELEMALAGRVTGRGGPRRVYGCHLSAASRFSATILLGP